MLWIDTKSEADAINRSEVLWTPVIRNLPEGGWVANVPGPELENGDYWGDAIAEAADNPALRLAIAKRHLPLPGAFRQMILALRAMVRERKRDGQEIESVLREMHHLAAIQSWCLPYNEIAQEPGFNVLEATPYAKLAALNLEWPKIGCNALLGLNKTDRVLMIKLWGDPDVHTTANTLYSDLWKDACKSVADRRILRRAALLEEIRDIARS